jgi:hypothetical protein
VANWLLPHRLEDVSGSCEVRGVLPGDASALFLPGVSSFPTEDSSVRIPAESATCRSQE